MAARVTAFVVFAIVAVTLVAGLIVGAQRADENGPVDLIVYNARVYTGTPDEEFAEAIAIRGNRIVRVGSNREIKRLMRRATTVLDAHGGTVTAGFHDGSVNLRAAGFALEDVSVRAAMEAAGATDAAGATAAPGAAGAPGAAATAPGTTTSAAAASGAKASASAAAATVAAGATASPTATATAPAGAVPTAAAAPMTAGPATPAAGTSTTAGERARAGQTAVAQPDGSRTVDGPEGAHGDTLEAIRRAISEANSVGVTSVDVTARTPDDLLPYDTLLRTRELTARVTAALAADWPLDDAGFARLEATRKRYEGVPFFKVEGVRLTVSDGLDEGGLAGAAAGANTRSHARSGQGRSSQARSPVGQPAHAQGRAQHGQRRAGTGAKMAPAPLASVQRVTDLARTIAALEQRGWQVILQTADTGDAALAIDGVEAMTRLPAPAIAPSGDRPATADQAASGAATSGATTNGAATNGGAATAAVTAPAKHRVRLELSASVDDATVARLTKLGIIASVQKPAAPPRRLALAPAASDEDAPDADAQPGTGTPAAAGDGGRARLSAGPAGLAGLAGSAAKATTGAAGATRADSMAAANAASTGATASAASADARGSNGKADADATGDSGVAASPAGRAAASAVDPTTRVAIGADTPASPEPWPFANVLAGTAPFLFHSGWPAAPIDPRFALSAVLIDGLLALTSDDADDAAPVPTPTPALNGKPTPRETAAAPSPSAADRDTLSKRLARAIDGYTRFAAFASQDEDRQGTVAKEMLADLVIFSGDLFTLPADKLLAAEVTTTIFDGKVVYTRRPEPAPVSESQ